MSTEVIYLDNNAATRLADDAFAAMTPLLTDQYGNASSTHHFGAQSAVLVEQARGEVADLVGARPSEIVFTSGGTEACNAALRGALAARPQRRGLVISAVEHAAVIEPAEALQREGVDLTRVGVDADGRLRMDELGRALSDETAVVSVMLANNETGVVFPVAEVAAAAHARGALLHVDAVQAVGKTPVDVAELGVDLLSLSAHKLHGPKGVGALFVRRGTAWRPWLLGGGQERGRRGGTLNTPGIVGMGRACALAGASLVEDERRMAALRDALEAELLARIDGAQIIGASSPRLPNTACLCVPNASGELLIIALSEAGVCASSGAACSSGSLEPSHVLAAMGVPPELAQGQLRLSLSRETTRAEIDRAAELIVRCVARVRGG